jgi:arylsulfatase A-like enzyme
MPQQATPDRTLPCVLEEVGYDTFGAFAFPTPFVALKSWYQKHRVWPDVRAESVVQRYNRWRQARDRTFGYLHFGDLHAPLNPPSKYVEQYDLDWSLGDLRNIVEYTDSYDGSEACRRYREHRLRLYRAALDYLEDQLRPLVNRILDDTVIILVGDHGEAHWEQYQHGRRFTDSRPNYGVGHGGTPFDMVARVPLGVSTPDTNDLSPEGGWASLIDIPKTLTSRVFENTGFDGYDWASETISEERVVLSEGVRYGSERKSIYTGDQKIIHSREDGVTLRGTVSHDQPGETLQLVQSEERPGLVSDLPDDWEYIGTNVETSEMVEDQLQALGYN